MQPDTIIPSLSNPQSWNRYSYVTNRPVNFNDPTGNRETSPCSELAGGCHVTQQIIDRDKGDENYFRLRTQALECQAGNKTYCADQSDAHFHSVSGSLGGGPWFLTVSIDVVNTDDEVGIFFSYGTGPGLRDPYTRDFRGLNDYESTFMTPQAGITVWGGRLYGESLNESVDNYSGPAIQGGGSGGPFAFETFSSVGKDDGTMDLKITGEAYGVGVSAQQGEVHVNYANAVNIKPLSFIVTWTCRLVGICKP